MQPEISEADLANLAEIFTRHKVLSQFGLHLVHGHFSIPPDTIMLGNYVSELSGYWTKPTAIKDVDLNNIHGHIFVLKGTNDFVAYEYRNGAPVNLSVSAEFFGDVSQYFRKNGLEDVLGLEVLNRGASVKMAEFDLGADSGTIMLKEAETNHGGVHRITGWAFEQREGIVSCNGGSVHAKTVRQTHQVFIGTQPLKHVQGLVDALQGEDII